MNHGYGIRIHMMIWMILDTSYLSTSVNTSGYWLAIHMDVDTWHVGYYLSIHPYAIWDVHDD